MISIQDVVGEIGKYWTPNAPLGSFDPIDGIEAYLGAALPADYKYFAQWFSNGGEGDLPGGYLQLFQLDEILIRQRDYELDVTKPAFMVIGLEGDHIFCFDVTRDRAVAGYRVLELPIGCHDDSDEIRVVGSSFVEFLALRLRTSNNE